MTQHDFKAALDAVKSYSLHDGGLVKLTLKNKEMRQTVLLALRIAERLQSGEVSEGVSKAMEDEEIAYDTPDGWVGYYNMSDVFRAMAQQLIKECE